ncbi:synaptonemal complex central element protein 1 [Biomphalaria glabrata]|nr:synaptonemal complex central element protein 1 [Biomphalaria glabrata]
MNSASDLAFAHQVVEMISSSVSLPISNTEIESVTFSEIGVEGISSSIVPISEAGASETSSGSVPISVAVVQEISTSGSVPTSMAGIQDISTSGSVPNSIAGVQEISTSGSVPISEVGVKEIISESVPISETCDDIATLLADPLFVSFMSVQDKANQVYYLREEGLTPEEVRLKNYITYLSKVRCEEKKEFLQIQAALKAKLNSLPRSVKNLKQTIKRREDAIQFLKEKIKAIKTETGHYKFKEMEQLFLAEKKRHRELFKEAAAFRKLKTRLEARNATIQKLQQEKPLLLEAMKELESQINSLKENNSSLGDSSSGEKQ